MILKWLGKRNHWNCFGDYSFLALIWLSETKSQVGLGIQMIHSKHLEFAPKTQVSKEKKQIKKQVNEK